MTYLLKLYNSPLTYDQQTGQNFTPKYTYDTFVRNLPPPKSMGFHFLYKLSATKKTTNGTTLTTSDTKGSDR